MSVHRVLHDAATTVIEELRNATKETVRVAVLDGREVVYVERLESPHTLRIFGRVGHRNSAHCTSTGKVLLAHLPERHLAALLEEWRPERRPTPPSATPSSCWPSWTRSSPGVGREHRRERGRGGQRGRPGPGTAVESSLPSACRAGDAVNGDTLRRFFRASVVQAADAISDQLGWCHRGLIHRGTPSGFPGPLQGAS